MPSVKSNNIQLEGSNVRSSMPLFLRPDVEANESQNFEFVNDATIGFEALGHEHTFTRD